MKKSLIFGGIGTALITPMRNEKIDYPALSKIIEAQIKGGVSALIIGGTTGEAATLSDKERYKLYAYAKERVDGRVKIIFGAGTNDTRAAIKHTENATRIGCDGILVVTPYYNKGTYRGVFEHYKSIATATDTPIILYNVPSRTGVNLTLEQIEELSKCENIVGIKEASDSADRLVELSKFKDELYLYAGADLQTYTVLSLGGAGIISVVSNLYPEKMVSIYKNFKAGKNYEALTEQQELIGFIKVMFKETNPAPIKYAMSLAGFCSDEVRLPLYPVEEETRRVINKEIERLSHL